MEAKIGTYGSVVLEGMTNSFEKTDNPEDAIINAARVSYGKGTKVVSTSQNLLRYLFRNQHMTPFEMITFRFVIEAPIFTARQWMRHRAGSYNEISARYTEMEDKFYIPHTIKIQSKVNKQCSGASHEDQQELAAKFAEIYDKIYAEYQGLLERGVSREQARAILPVGLYTKFYWQVNLRMLLHFLSLRMDTHAQDDIREYATAIYNIIKPFVPQTIQAYNDYVINSITITEIDLEIAEGDTSRASSREIEEYKNKIKKIVKISDTI